MNQILLINVSGRDQPGLAAGLIGALADYGVAVLDIGQASIHAELSLGFMVEVPADVNSAMVRKELLFKAHEFKVQVSFTEISAVRYAKWVSGQGKPRHLITLLSRRLESQQLAEVTAVIAAHGLNIDKITRLSGRPSLDLSANESGTQACVEFSVRGELNRSALQSDFLPLANQLNIDVAVQRDDIFRRNRRLVAFDMDSTLIEVEVIDELAKAAGVGDRVAEITERTMRGELDFTASFTERLALLKGLDESVLAQIAERLPITEGAEKLISNLRELGFKTAILSGGFNYFGRYLQSKLGIDHVFANELEIENGKVTGRVTGKVVDGVRKAELLEQIAAQEGIRLEQTIAVGDGANDLPMLGKAGLGIAFRAKPMVRQSADQALTTLGLDGILYLIGFRDRETFDTGLSD